jgi:hypothetical protein
VGCTVTDLYRLDLERPGLEKENISRRWSELSTCFSVATPRMSFSYWYTLPTPSVEGTSRVSKSVVATVTFWLALGKVGCAVPLWLMVTAMATALARAQALV